MFQALHNILAWRFALSFERFDISEWTEIDSTDIQPEFQ